MAKLDGINDGSSARTSETSGNAKEKLVIMIVGRDVVLGKIELDDFFRPLLALFTCIARFNSSLKGSAALG